MKRVWILVSLPKQASAVYDVITQATRLLPSVRLGMSEPHWIGCTLNPTQQADCLPGHLKNVTKACSPPCLYLHSTPSHPGMSKAWLKSLAYLTHLDPTTSVHLVDAVTSQLGQSMARLQPLVRLRMK